MRRSPLPRLRCVVPVVVRIALVLALALVPSGCGFLGEAPDEVTRRFWSAVQRGDEAGALELASAASGRLVAPTLEEVSIVEVLVGDALRNDEAAMVATTLVLLQEDQELDATFHTHLVREGDHWRVDVAASRDELRKGVFVAGMREIGEAVGEGVQELGEAIREGAREMEDALREALEGLDDGSRL